MNLKTVTSFHPISRTPFPHPASMFSPAGSRPMYTPSEPLANLSGLAIEYARCTEDSQKTAGNNSDR
jgi:hypothetical protein